MQLVDKEYIKTVSRDERRKHLKLEEPCIERGGASGEFRGLLAHHLNTTIPAKGQKVCLCHACHNARCSNPNHLYWGNDHDNKQDHIESGTYLHPTVRMRIKHGDEYVREKAKLAGKAAAAQRATWSAEKRSQVAKLGVETRQKKIGPVAHRTE